MFQSFQLLLVPLTFRLARSEPVADDPSDDKSAVSLWSLIGITACALIVFSLLAYYVVFGPVSDNELVSQRSRPRNRNAMITTEPVFYFLN